MRHYQHLKIQQLRMKNLTKVLESILAYLAALFITALLPSLLVRYLYSQDQLMTESPKLLEYIPVLTFAVAVLYMVGVMIGNFRRERLARSLEAQLESMSMGDGDCCGGGKHMDSDISMEELEELDAIVESAIKAGPKKTASKSKTATKSKTTKTSTKRKKTK